MQIQFDYWALQNANFTTSKEAYDLGETLRRPLDLKTSASIARLALGRSLNEAAPPEEISHVSPKIIRGHTLKQVAHPDRLEFHHPLSHCGQSLSEAVDAYSLF